VDASSKPDSKPKEELKSEETKEKVAAPDEIATVQPKVEESKAPTTAPAPIKNLNPNSQSFVPKAKNPIPSDIKNSLPSTAPSG